MTEPEPAAFARALALHQQGQLSEAEPLYRQAADAGHTESRINLAVVCLQLGRASEARLWAEQAAKAAPASAEALVTLATAIQACGDVQTATDVFDDALALDPDRAEAHYGLGRAFSALGRVDEALACCRRALSIDPDYAEAECLLGDLLSSQPARQIEAIEAYRRALDIDPDFDEARHGLARALRAAGRTPEAEAEYRALLTASPADDRAWSGLVAALMALHRHDEALHLLRDAVAGRPDDPQAHRNLGLALAEAGELAEAERALTTAIALRPRPAYFRELAILRRTRSLALWLATLRAMAADIETFDVADQVQVHFALGRALTDIGEPASGFRHFQAGNGLHRLSLDYDEIGTLRLFDQIQETFTPDLMRAKSGMGAPADSPIFIVGMPRCGSTLVDQILVSHPLIHGAGETTAFGDAVYALGGDPPYPDLVEGMRAADLGRVAGTYLARVRSQSGGAPRTSDKMLANAMFVGLIHLALPRARILHMRRDPVDTCLSCFAELFTPDQPFTHDLGELGRFYHAHDRLMRHWHDILPADVMMTVDYEDLVADFDRVVARILTHCDVPWDDRVRDFHLTRRPVRSASLAQVRRPLYSAPSVRWRPSEPDLRPLLEGLAG